MNGGQIVAKTLIANGVKHLFTLCGGHIGPIYVEAERAGMRVWDVRHEATAVFAADAVARLTGIPGAAAVTAGPGVTNAITALKNAQMAQSPILLLGGATATLLRNRGALQDIDQLALLRSSVKQLARPDRLRLLAPALGNAIQAAVDGIPGPIFLECPVDLLYPEATVREWYGRKNQKASGLLDRLERWYIHRHLNRLFASVSEQPPRARLPRVPLHTGGQLQATLENLRKAQRPVLLLSSGAMLGHARVPALAEAVQRLGVPVYLSGMARGLLGHHHPLQCLHHRKEALREADLIILAGVPCDFRLDYGRVLNRHAAKIAVNRSRHDLHQNLRGHRAIQADPSNLLIALAAEAGNLPEWAGWKETLRARDVHREEEIGRLATQTVDGINPVALFQHLEQTLPENSILIADGGDFAATAAYTLRPRKPLSWLDPGVFGTLGVGGGFALGAAACRPDAYIWIIYGDGSAAYSLAEFETFTKNGLKVCGIVGNNGSWEQIARDQITLLGADTAVRLPHTDYHTVAQGYGAAGERVDTLEAFQQAVRNAIRSMDDGKPYLINALIGSTAFREGSISM